MVEINFCCAFVMLIVPAFCIQISSKSGSGDELIFVHIVSEEYPTINIFSKKSNINFTSCIVMEIEIYSGFIRMIRGKVNYIGQEVTVN